MLRRFLRLLSGASAVHPPPPLASSRVAVQVAPDRPISRDGPLPVYPPVDVGIPVVDPVELVTTQHDLVQRLRRHLALPQSRWEEGYLAPITRVAALVGLLPATRSEHHSGQGGLFRLALETGFAAARGSDGVIFSAASAVDRRRNVEVAWRHAAFLGGIAAELHRPLTDMVVVAANGATWSPYMGSLHDWARRVQTDRVWVRWTARAVRPQGTQTSALWVMPAVVGAKTMADLHEADPAISQVLAAVCAGVADKIHEHQLARVVRTSLDSVRNRDLALQPSLYGSLTQGSHLEPWLLDAMRVLVRRGSWRINEPGSALALMADGLYLRWPQCSVELIEELASRGGQGVPTHEATLAELLLSAGIVARSPSNDAVWGVAFPGESDRVPALRLVRPDVLLAALEDPTSVTPAPAPPSASPEDPDAAAPATKPTALAPPVVPVIQLPHAANAAPSTQAQTDRTTAATAPGGLVVDAPTSEVSAAPAAERSGAQSTTGTQAASGEPTGERKTRRPGAPITAPESPGASSGPQLDPELVRALGSPAIAGLIAEWVQAWNTGMKRHCFERTPDGLALRLDILNGAGVGSPEIFKALRENGWIKLFERPGGKSQPLTKIAFTAGHTPETTHAFVLTEPFCRHAGFTL